MILKSVSYTHGKKTVLDLVCVDQEDKTFIVEMQASEEDYFFERCVYYAAGPYYLELSDGERYTGFHPVYVVSFLNYRLRHDDESLWDTDHFISYWHFTEKRTGMVADQTISVIFMEITLFTKTLEECVTAFDKETKLSIAKKLFAAGTPIDVIVSCTGVDNGTIASFARLE